jgi:hypothetical protein
MAQADHSKLAIFECVARKSELDLARQRRLVDDLRSDGSQSNDAEAVLKKFEMLYAALVAKLELLRAEQP